MCCRFEIQHAASDIMNYFLIDRIESDRYFFILKVAAIRTLFIEKKKKEKKKMNDDDGLLCGGSSENTTMYYYCAQRIISSSPLCPELHPHEWITDPVETFLLHTNDFVFKTTMKFIALVATFVLLAPCISANGAASSVTLIQSAETIPSKDHPDAWPKCNTTSRTQKVAR